MFTAIAKIARRQFSGSNYRVSAAAQPAAASLQGLQTPFAVSLAPDSTQHLVPARVKLPKAPTVTQISSNYAHGSPQSVQLTLQYRDNVAIDSATVDTNNLQNIQGGARFNLVAADVSWSLSENDKVLTATYTLVNSDGGPILPTTYRLRLSSTPVKNVDGEATASPADRFGGAVALIDVL